MAKKEILKKVLKGLKAPSAFLKGSKAPMVGALIAGAAGAAYPVMSSVAKYKKELEAERKSHEMVGKLSDKRREQIIARRKKIKEQRLLQDQLPKKIPMKLPKILPKK